MRWLPYLILAYIALGLQIGLSPHVRYHGAVPNLGLLAVIFIAINAPRDAAMLGAFGIGLVQDLLSAQPPGLYALSYGIVAAFVTAVSSAVYREHPLAHLTLTFIGGLMTAFMLLLHGWIHPPGPATVDGKTVLSPVRLAPSTLFLGVLYTTILAPFLIGGLQRIKRVFAFRSPRRKIRM